MLDYSGHVTHSKRALLCLQILETTPEGGTFRKGNLTSKENILTQHGHTMQGEWQMLLEVFLNELSLEVLSRAM